MFNYRLNYGDMVISIFAITEFEGVLSVESEKEP